jgi:hypothetical protein
VPFTANFLSNFLLKMTTKFVVKGIKILTFLYHNLCRTFTSTFTVAITKTFTLHIDVTLTASIVGLEDTTFTQLKIGPIDTTFTAPIHTSFITPTNVTCTALITKLVDPIL